VENSNISFFENKINHSLNFVTCIAIFAVICIHCELHYIGTEGLIIDALARFSVVIFFMISGFFSFYDDSTKAFNKYKHRINKLIKLLLIGSFLYFIYMLLADLPQFLELLNLDTIFNLVMFDITPFGFHLWFILALIYCYVLYYFLIKFHINPNRLYKFIPILVLFSLFLSEYCAKAGIFFSFEYYRNFLLMGLPFFTLGYLIHDKKDILIENISNSFLIGFGVFSFLLTILEVLTIGKLDIFLGTIIFSLCIFIWCIKNPNTLNFKITEFIGRKLHSSIYILHLMIYWIISPDLGYLNPIICFIPTTIICTIIYVIISKLKEKKMKFI